MLAVLLCSLNIPLLTYFTNILYALDALKLIAFRRMKNRRIRKREEEIIDLTDIGHNNSMPVIRELDQDPVTGLVTMRSITDSPTKNNAFNDTPIHFVEEDKGQGYPEPYTPADPEPEADERLEMEGAQIIDSTTYYPESRTTITKKSKTPAEIAEERGYHDFYER
jgi:hypothetical protein